MEVTFLGGAREVGRSAVLFNGEKRVLIDYGVKLNRGRNSETDYPMRLRKPVDAFVMSHAHLDHSGFAPALYDVSRMPCLATYPTQALSQLLLIDFIKIAKKPPFSANAYARLVQNFFPVPYERELEIGGKNTKLTLHDAGHIPGAAISELVSEGKRIVYTADFKLEDTMLHNAANFVEDVDTLIIESTYSEREHPPRIETVKKMAESIRGVIEQDGNVLLPAFAVGRSQELVMVLHEFDSSLRVYLDGMAKGAAEVIMQYPKYLRDADALSEALDWAEWIEGPADRRRALAEPGVIVSTAGMLEGGPAINYLLRMREDPKNKVIFTGFNLERTNGWYLMNTHKIKVEGEWAEVNIPVEYYDLSAHSGRSDLLSFIEHASPEKVLCVHGDKCEEFAAELKGKGYDAHAPKMGETVVL